MRYRPDPRYRTYRNGGTFPVDGKPPTPYPTVTDFRIEVPRHPTFGVEMEWVSDKLGLLTTFPYWLHLEADRRLKSGWMPVGTVERPFFEIDQGWQVAIWEDAPFIYVEQGDEESGTFHTWYRVPAKVFRTAWATAMVAIRRASDPPRSTDAG